MNLATDVGSFIDAGRLFHNTDPLNFNKRLPKEEFTDSQKRVFVLFCARLRQRCKLIAGRIDGLGLDENRGKPAQLVSEKYY